jgi:hypothetical protein
VSGIAAADNSFQVAASELLPEPPFLLKIDNEVVEVGALHRGTGVCSEVARGQRNTTAASHASGAAVEDFKTATQTRSPRPSSTRPASWSGSRRRGLGCGSGASST